MGSSNLPGWLLLVETLLCFTVVFWLHSLRRRMSLGFSFAALTFMTFASWAAPHQTAVTIVGLDFYVESNVFFSATLLNVFLLYVVDGPRLGRIGLGIVVGTGVVYTALALMLHAQFPDAEHSIFPSANLRSAGASILASLVDLLVLGVGWECFQKTSRIVPLFFRVFLTLLLVLLVDSLVYVPLAWGESPRFPSMLAGGMVSRSALAILYAPWVTAYLHYEIAHHGWKLSGRPLLSIFSREDLELELLSTRHNLRLGAEALWESEERYRRMVDDLPTMVFRFTLEGTVTYANRALCEYYGQTPEEILGKHVLEPIEKRERDETWDKILQLRAENPVLDLSTHAYPRPGDRRLQRWVVRGIFGKEGQGLAFQAVGEDITQQARAEARIRLLGAALEHARELVVIVDERQEVCYANHAFGRAMGQEPGSLVGLPSRDLLELVRDEATLAELERVVQERKSWAGRVPLHFAQWGDRTIRLSVTPLSAEAWVTSGLVLVGSDVTEEMALQKRAQELEKAEAISRMAAGVAHDFNNLIQVIWTCAESATADLAERTDGTSRSVREALQLVRQSADRAAVLARQLMTLGRSAETTPEPLNLTEAVQRIAPLLARFAPQGVPITYELDDTEPTAVLDSTQFERLLINLVTNAGDATPVGGRIVVRTSTSTIDGEVPASRAGLAPGKYATLSVEDSGQGMDEATLERMFEPFFTTKEAGKGTGLGLATVFAIVRHAGGVVTVDSHLDQGTRFDVYFPLAAGKAPASRALDSRPPLVLYCDKDADLRDWMSVVLQLAGYEVLAEEHIEQLFRRAHELGESKQVFLVDVVSTDDAGSPAYRAIEEQFPEVPMVLIQSSGSAVVVPPGEPTVPESQSPRFRAVLRKPFDRNALLAAVKEALRGAR